MFTGIVRSVLKVSQVKNYKDYRSLVITANPYILEKLELGASIAIDGTCLTVKAFDQENIWFDVIQETLQKTTLGQLKVGDSVHAERAAKFGDEIGGHELSGHIFGIGAVEQIDLKDHHRTLTCRVPRAWMKYFLQKGFIAIDGVSLTVTDIDPQGLLKVHLIPETLKLTKLGAKNVGDSINIEVDSRTQAIVDTVETMLANQKLV